ncbi:MAG: hypothetical protein P8X63_15595, partial [Desulfuromonadaceae bacterium]
MLSQALELFELWHGDDPEGMALAANWRHAMAQNSGEQEQRTAGSPDRRKGRRPRRRPRKPKRSGPTTS